MSQLISVDTNNLSIEVDDLDSREDFESDRNSAERNVASSSSSQYVTMFDNDDYELSSDALLLVPALPVAPLDDDEDDEPPSFDEDDAEAYLRRVRWEAQQLEEQHLSKQIENHNNKRIASQMQSSSDVDHQKSLSADLDEHSERPRKQSTASSQQQSTAKRRCGYLEYLLQLDTRSADKPSSIAKERTSQQNDSTSLDSQTSPSSCIQDSSSSPQESILRETTIKPNDDNVWRTAALKSFSEFRQFLEVLSTVTPELSGEGDVSPEQRDWDEDEWDVYIQSNDASVTVIGAMDTVRSIAVLESVANYLKATNRDLASAKNAKFHGLPELTGAIKPSLLVCRRVLRWAFAALANLDSLQAFDADVAHVLQIIRRCCRWLKSIVIDADVQGDLRLVEVVIQDFFYQR